MSGKTTQPWYKPLPPTKDDPILLRTKKQNVFVFILIAALFIGSVGYIAYDEYGEYMEKHDAELAQEAMLYGSEQTIIEILRIAVNCQYVPLTVQNQTLQLVAVDCINMRSQNG